MTPAVSIRSVSTADLLQLPDKLKGYRVVFDVEDGPMVAIGTDPDSDRPVLVWHSPVPSTVITVGGAALAHAHGGTQTSYTR